MPDTSYEAVRMARGFCSIKEASAFDAIPASSHVHRKTSNAP